MHRQAQWWSLCATSSRTWPVKALVDAEFALADVDFQAELLVDLDEDAFFADDVGLNEKESTRGLVFVKQTADRVDHIVNRFLLCVDHRPKHTKSHHAAVYDRAMLTSNIKHPYLRGKGILGVAVCGVEVQHVGVVKALLQRWASEQVGGKTHVTGMDVASPVWQLKQKLNSARAVVGVDQGDFDACQRAQRGR